MGARFTGWRGGIRAITAGITVMATSKEASREKDTVAARGLKITLVIPSIKNMGINTTTVVRVEAKIGANTVLSLIHI